MPTFGQASLSDLDVFAVLSFLANSGVNKLAGYDRLVRKQLRANNYGVKPAPRFSSDVLPISVSSAAKWFNVELAIYDFNRKSLAISTCKGILSALFF